jgi:hypothetical protein
MPARSTRCTYAERGRRCRRNGTGQPVLCQAHRVVLAEVAQGATGIGGIDSIIEEVFRTGGVSAATLQQMARDAMNTVAQALGGFGGVAYPQMPRYQNGVPRPGQAPPRPPPRRAPPPPDPDEVARQRARQVLGFTPREPLTEEVIKARRRDLALRHHPDRGGSVDAMSKVNDAADTLLAAV